MPRGYPGTGPTAHVQRPLQPILKQHKRNTAGIRRHHKELAFLMKAHNISKKEAQELLKQQKNGGSTATLTSSPSVNGDLTPASIAKFVKQKRESLSGEIARLQGQLETWNKVGIDELT
jgi:hypothetical protein